MNSKSVYIIAEAGVNHNGSLDNARKLVDAAADAGVDCVKFQTFKTESLVSKKTDLADYQKEQQPNVSSQFEMLKALELTFNEHRVLADYCRLKGVEYCSTPFDDESMDFLAELGVPFWKIPSGDITNIPFLRRIGSSFKPVILSTGMADMADIAVALNTLQESGIPLEDITVLHCHTEYPTDMDDVNLMAMNTIKKAFHVEVGYSDHTLGIEIPAAAVALGAVVIEKHYTLDKKMNGPDHKASLNPEELKLMVSAIRNVEKALGDGIKVPSSNEIKNRAAARKSIIAKVPIKKGDVFSEDNLSVKRPGDGISPLFFDHLVGLISGKDYDTDDLI